MLVFILDSNLPLQKLSLGMFDFALPPVSRYEFRAGVFLFVFVFACIKYVHLFLCIFVFDVVRVLPLVN